MREDKVLGKLNEPNKPKNGIMQPWQQYNEAA